MFNAPSAIGTTGSPRSQGQPRRKSRERPVCRDLLVSAWLPASVHLSPRTYSSVRTAPCAPFPVPGIHPHPSTVPGIKHVCDEVVDERDLGFGDAAGISVKNRHHHRQVPLLLFICLQGGKCQNYETPGPGSTPARSIPSTRAFPGSPQSLVGVVGSQRPTKHPTLHDVSRRPRWDPTHIFGT